MSIYHLTEIRRRREESGYALLAVLMVSLVTAIAMATATDVLKGGVKTVNSTTLRTKDYVQAENTYAQAVQWLRDNQKSMASVFSSTQFSKVFTRGAASVGCNDLQDLRLPTRVKLASAPCNSVILVSDPSLLRNPLGSTPSGSFPITTNLANGEPFLPQASLQATDFGGKEVRITLIDAVTKGTANTSTLSGMTGDSCTMGSNTLTPSGIENDLRPLYRIDVFDREQIKTIDRGNPLSAPFERTYQRDTGTHIFGYVSGEPQYNYGSGFFGWSYTSVSTPCDSYRSKDGPYSQAAARANCPLVSAGAVRVSDGLKIYGSVFYVSTIGSSNFDQVVCGDMQCKTPGRVTQGISAQEAPPRPTFESWSSYCPSNQGALTVASTKSVTLTVPGDRPNQKCWSKLSVSGSASVTLTSTDYPYFFDQIELSNLGRLIIAPKDPNGVVTIYTQSIAAPLTGNQFVNSANRPSQLQINYLGTNNLNVWGSAPFQGFITAPRTTVVLSSSLEFRGGIRANTLLAMNLGGLHYDESAATPLLEGMSYRLRDIAQVYRR